MYQQVCIKYCYGYNIYNLLTVYSDCVILTSQPLNRHFRRFSLVDTKSQLSVNRIDNGRQQSAALFTLASLIVVVNGFWWRKKCFLFTTLLSHLFANILSRRLESGFVSIVELFSLHCRKVCVTQHYNDKYSRNRFKSAKWLFGEEILFECHNKYRLFEHYVCSRSLLSCIIKHA